MQRKPFLCSFVLQLSILIIYIMDNVEKVLETIKSIGEPVNAGKVAEVSGIDRKDVDKAFKKLKEEGKISSPKRCYWVAV